MRYPGPPVLSSRLRSVRRCRSRPSALMSAFIPPSCLMTSAAVHGGRQEVRLADQLPAPDDVVLRRLGGVDPRRVALDAAILPFIVTLTLSGSGRTPGAPSAPSRPDPSVANATVHLAGSAAGIDEGQLAGDSVPAGSSRPARDGAFTPWRPLGLLPLDSPALAAPAAAHIITTIAKARILMVIPPCTL